jgi:hypothetical protein
MPNPIRELSHAITDAMDEVVGKYDLSSMPFTYAEVLGTLDLIHADLLKEAAAS